MFKRLTYVARELKAQYKHYWGHTDFKFSEQFKELRKKYKATQNKKPFRSQLKEVLRYTRYYKSIPYDYLKYKLYRDDIPTENILDYVPSYVHMRWVHKVSNHRKQHQLLLNNKIFFKRYLDSYNIKTAKSLFYIMNRTYYDRNMNIITIDDALAIVKSSSCDTVFYKMENADSATGIGWFVRDKDTGRFVHDGTVLDKAFVESMLTRGNSLFEEGLKPHPLLAEFHPQSLNVFRILTRFRPGKGANAFFAAIKIGTSGSMMDNTCKGGVFVPIDIETGEMSSVAYDINLDTHEIHPDTKIVYKGRTIPFIKEVVDISLQCANLMPTVPFIGWDIAYTGDGPVVVEGNYEWGCGWQVSINGLRAIVESETSIESLKLFKSAKPLG